MSGSLQPYGCSTPGFTVLHCLPEFAQTHVHWVSNTIKPSHPLHPLFPPPLNLSKHQRPFFNEMYFIEKYSTNFNGLTCLPILVSFLNWIKFTICRMVPDHQTWTKKKRFFQAIPKPVKIDSLPKIRLVC